MLTNVDREVKGERKQSGLKIWLKALRVHQYVKNTLILLPIIAGHAFNRQSLGDGAIAFVAFSFAASAMYLINDLVDLEDDQSHPSKKHRPLASGLIRTSQAMAVIPVLLSLSAGLSLLLPVKFVITLFAYVAMTAAYSFWLKRKMLIDVVLLSLLYSVRVVAGGYAASVSLSTWLIAFCIFIFTSLALIKRYTELLVRSEFGLPDARNRGYTRDDLPIIAMLAAATGANSVTVLCLYIASPQVTLLYNHPQWLWMLCPLLLFFMSRALLVAHRRNMDDDPIVWALRDRVCRQAAVIAACVVAAATFI